MQPAVGANAVNLAPMFKTATDYTDFTETYSSGLGQQDSTESRWYYNAHPRAGFWNWRVP